MLWLCANLPNLGLEMVTRGHAPHQAGTSPVSPIHENPIVLVENNLIVDLDATAEACGIAAGSSLATANSIHPNVVHFVRDPVRESQRLQFLAECFQRFAPDISLYPSTMEAQRDNREAMSLLLEVSRSARLFNGIDTLLEQVRALGAKTGHQFQLGLAKTPYAALALARSHRRQLLDVPLECSELDPKDQRTLADMGVHTLGALLTLPKDELGERFGAELGRYLDRLTGALPHPLSVVTPKANFVSRLHLLEPLNNKQSVLPYMQQLLAELSQWLITRQLGADRLHWRFAPNVRSASVDMAVSFAKPLQNSTRFLNISELRLAQIELPDEVLSLELHCQRPAPWRGASNALFAPGVLPPPSQTPSKVAAVTVDSNLEELLDQLTARLEGRNLFGIGTTDDRRPEHAWVMTRPLMGAQPPASRDTSRRPLWLFNEPQPVARRQLELLQGPERIHTGWWQDNIQRDYYVARLRDTQCWAFVDKQADTQEAWFVHGYFG